MSGFAQGSVSADRSDAMTAEHGFVYSGDETLRGGAVQALRRVVDPEMALNIVDIGLVYEVEVRAGRVRVLMTMTSAACPVTDLVVEDVMNELAAVLPAGYRVDVDICWEPAWEPGRMSAAAKAFMGWD